MVLGGNVFGWLADKAPSLPCSTRFAPTGPGEAA
jgi:hypothetical protein